MNFSTHKKLWMLVPSYQSFWINFGVKAAQIDDRKLIRIALIRINLRSLRSSISASFHARNCLKTFGNWALGLGLSLHLAGSSPLSAQETGRESAPAAELYINLIKHVVANTIYEDRAISGEPYCERLRISGEDHPFVAHTMIGIKRLTNIQYCLEEILKENIPGDCIETGVWRGGATIFMRAILKAYGDTTRKVWVVDSFKGLPPPNPDKYPADEDLDLSDIPYLAVSVQTVKKNFKKYALLDDQVVFLEGYFSDTLPTCSIDKISLLRLDGDLYESTWDALTHLYPKVSTGGYVIIDDFGYIPACAQAVNDYRELHGITDPIHKIDYTGVYWKKT